MAVVSFVHAAAANDAGFFLASSRIPLASRCTKPLSAQHHQHCDLMITGCKLSVIQAAARRVSWNLVVTAYVTFCAAFLLLYEQAAMAVCKANVPVRCFWHGNALHFPVTMKADALASFPTFDDNPCNCRQETWRHQ